MFAWLAANYVNILLIAAVAAVVFFIIRGMVRDRKAGRSSCGGNCAACGGVCAGCAMSGACHGGKTNAAKAVNAR